MTHIIKARAMLGQLAAHGIEASRAMRGEAANGGPDALLVAADGRCWLVIIWSGGTTQAALFDEGKTPPLADAARALIAWRKKRVGAAGHLAPDLLILAPALPSVEIRTGHLVLDDETIPVISHRDCKKAVLLAQSLHRLTATVLPMENIARWRAAAVPEVRIESPWKRKAIQRPADKLAAPLLLDYKQERCARLDLEADPEAENLARDLHLRVITGVAGCGKTLVLVHRAALLATHFPQARVLLVSFNRPLINDLRRRLARHHAGNRVECLTFNQWLGRVARSAGDMMSEPEILRWIERERPPMTSLAKLSAEWLRDELRWMCDHALADESYLTAERKGRGTRLSARQRRELLDMLLRYRAHLRQSERADWSEWPLTVREKPPATLLAEKFDHLLIDEAQFFAPVWLELLKSALKPGGHLFLCADPTQGFLKRRLSWSAVGLDVRSRSHKLEKPYRSTRVILEFARDFYRSRLSEEHEPLNLPAPEWLETLEPGIPPILQPGGAGQDQLRRLTADLKSLQQSGMPASHILILVAGRAMTVQAVMQHLNTSLGSNSASSVRDDHAPEESIGVAHLMAATGLERPVVFLLGCDDLLATESNPLLTDEERAELIQDHTRQIYVGITRCMERVVIYADRFPNSFISDA
ncbi:MAG: AAA family ATPase [Verrucomicrobiaceae bacterium]|nr:AAA family ATPase [Verrucomicrobiaceae bacterium]